MDRRSWEREHGGERGLGPFRTYSLSRVEQRTPSPGEFPPDSGEYARLALGHGTPTVILDPHEIANVLGMAGIQALIEASEGLPLDFFLMAPSWVPAPPLETAGAILSSKEIQKLLEQERVWGLGEMMNFPKMLATHRLFHEFLPRAEPSHKIRVLGNQ